MDITGNNRTGWVRLDRAVMQDPRWLAEPFTWGQAVMDLAGLARFTDGHTYVRGNRVDVLRGQVAISREELAKRWMWSKAKVNRFLNRLESETLIDQQKSKLITIISVRYASPQASMRNTDDTTESTTESTTDDTTFISKKERRKEGKNGEYILAKARIPSPWVSVESDDSKSAFADPPSEEAPAPLALVAEDDVSGTEDRLDEGAVMRLWNESMRGRAVKPIRDMTQRRQGLVRARLAKYGADALRDVIRSVADSDFLNGQNARGWTADFNWAMRPENFVKILEGQYSDERPAPTPREALMTQNETRNGIYDDNRDERRLTQYERDRMLEKRHRDEEFNGIISEWMSPDYNRDRR